MLLAMSLPSVFALVALVFGLFLLGLHWMQRATDRIHQRREEQRGTPQQYDELCAEVPVTVETLEQFKRASTQRNALALRVRPGKNAEEVGAPLTDQQLRYFYELRDSIHQFAKLNPWLHYDETWHAARGAQIARIQTLVAQATTLQADGKLTYKGAIWAQETASRDATHAKNLISGNIRCEDEHHAYAVGHELEGLEHALEKAEQQAAKAIALFKAEAEGKLRYECSVPTLIQRAATDDLDKSEALLRQALAQAENPDADNNPTDLRRALESLAIVLFVHRDKGQEAVQLFERALALFPDNDKSEESTAIVGDLARVHAKLGNFAVAEQLFHDEHQRLVQEPHANMSAMCRSMEYLGDCYAHAGKHEEAERCYKQGLSIEKQYSAGRIFDMALERVSLLESLLKLQASRSQFQEALKTYNEMVSLQKKRSRARENEYQDPDDLRLYAKVLRACHHISDEQALLAKAEVMDERKAEIEDRIEHEGSSIPDNVLFHRQITRQVRELD